MCHLSFDRSVQGTRMDFPDPPSSFDVVADRQVTTRSLAAAWCLALAVFIGLATAPLLASGSRPSLLESVAAGSVDRPAAHQTVKRTC